MASCLYKLCWVERVGCVGRAVGMRVGDVLGWKFRAE